GQRGARRARDGAREAQRARGDVVDALAPADPVHPLHALARRVPSPRENAMITVLSPVGTLRAATTSIPALPADLRGLTVGFLDNTKHNFDRLVTEMGALLRERFGVARVVHRKKANAATAAAPEIVEAMAKECDLVLAGSAD